ncbi:HAD family hydrolase [Leptolyngbya sp. PCC 6406]|uniref:HAD family hydrolase n=1 Tax=Leptolyngbya sp. PCC 6406 TaxID=1173264 RepID=UPI0002AC7BC4|nr:HAD family phosphatase [Leptolyngbya sp. PCC 6406]
MALNAVFFELSGVIINDGALRQRLLDELLIGENLRPDPGEFDQVCRGRGDRTCLQMLLSRRGRVMGAEGLKKLLELRSQRYQEGLASLDRLPLYPGLEDFLYQLKVAQTPLGIVSGAQRGDVDWVLQRAKLATAFSILVTAEDLSPGGDKPAGEGYEVAIARLQDQYPDRFISPETCLAVESSFAGIAAAQAAGVPVVGVAHQYPYRMMQRRADVAVDYLNELDLDWLGRYYRD